MKKILLLTLCAALSITSLQAQYDVDSDNNSTTIINDEGQDILKIAADKRGNLSMRVGGFEITFGDDKKQEQQREGISKVGKVYDGKIPFFEYGFSLLTTPDYAIYQRFGGNDDTDDFMAMVPLRSVHVALNFFDTGMSVTRSGNVRLTAAFSTVWDNYVFLNNSVQNVGGRIEPLDLDGKDIKKSKLTTFALQIPVMLELSIAKKLFVSVGVYGEYATGYTKYKYPQTRSDAVNRCLSPFRYGYTARVGMNNCISLFGNYSCTPLFKGGKGPETNPYSFGVGFIF